MTSISLPQRADTRKRGNDVRHEDGEGHLKDPAARHLASENRIQVVDADQDNANHNCVSECPPNHGRLKGELEPRFHEVMTVAIGATEDVAWVRR